MQPGMITTELIQRVLHKLCHETKVVVCMCTFCSPKLTLATTLLYDNENTTRCATHLLSFIVVSGGKPDAYYGHIRKPESRKATRVLTVSYTFVVDLNMYERLYNLLLSAYT